MRLTKSTPTLIPIHIPLKSLRCNMRAYTTQTFGDILASSTGKTSAQAHAQVLAPTHIPRGYDILQSKFPQELSELRELFTKEAEKGTVVTCKEEVFKLLDIYVDGIDGGNGCGKKSTSLTSTQKKLLLAAYAKANRRPVSNGEMMKRRSKVGVLMRRNWPLLEYVAEISGMKKIDVSGNIHEDAGWGFAEELEEIEREKSDDATHTLKDETGDGGFNSMLRTLKKVHTTPMVHVLPKMTAFEAKPTIKRGRIGESGTINDLDVENFQNFLQSAKNASDDRDEMMFRAKTNYEWTTNLLAREPRTLEGKNFFTPICIPGTNIHTHDFAVKTVNYMQEGLKKQLHECEADQYSIVKIYADGSSGVLNNDGCVYWDGSVSNIFQLAQTLKQPELFKSRLRRYLENGWVPVAAEERELVMVHNKKGVWTTLWKRGLVVGITGMLSLSAIIGIGMLI